MALQNPGPFAQPSQSPSSDLPCHGNVSNGNLELDMDIDVTHNVTTHGAPNINTTEPQRRLLNLAGTLRTVGSVERLIQAKKLELNFCAASFALQWFLSVRSGTSLCLHTPNNDIYC